MQPQLPLSFIASIFGMNSIELNGGSMALKQQFIYMCKAHHLQLPTALAPKGKHAN